MQHRPNPGRTRWSPRSPGHRNPRRRRRNHGTADGHADERPIAEPECRHADADHGAEPERQDVDRRHGDEPCGAVQQGAVLDRQTVEQKRQGRDERDREQAWLVVEGHQEWRHCGRHHRQDGSDCHVDPEQRRCLLVRHNLSLNGGDAQPGIPEQAQ